MPFLLPCKSVAKLFERGDANFILSRDILEEDGALLRAHAQACACKVSKDRACGDHCFEFPFHSRYRFPFFCVKKAFQVKQRIMDSALQVLVWSFQQMALGLRPPPPRDMMAPIFMLPRRNFASIYQDSLCHWDAWSKSAGIGNQTESMSLISMPLGGRIIMINGILS